MTDEVELRPEDMDYVLYLITQPGCPGCLQAETALEDHIKAGYIKKLNVDDPKAKELCDRLNIMHLPALVIEKDGKCAECELKVEGDDVLIDCPDLDQMEEKNEPQQEQDIEEEIQRLIKGRGQLVIKCLDPVVKAQLANMLMDKTPDVVRQLLFALPPCEDGKLIDFERVKLDKGSKSTSEYLEFMKKCLKEVEGATQAEKMKKCAERWKEEKKKKESGRK